MNHGELDNSLREVADLERIACNLTQEERHKCASLSIDTALMARAYCAAHLSSAENPFTVTGPYGILCATSAERN